MEYEYECPEDLDAQTDAFMVSLLITIGPYGVKRDGSIEFVQRCLLPAIEEQDQMIILDVDEYLDVFCGV